MTTCELSEPVLTVMRAMRAEADRAHELSRQQSPRFGEIAMGSEHVRSFLKHEVLATYLGALGKHKFAHSALLAGIEEGRMIARKFNARREYQVHIWEGAGESILMTWHLRILDAIAADIGIGGGI